MPKKNTVLSLKRRQILELPGFELCHAYLYYELKGFVRTQMREEYIAKGIHSKIKI